MKTKRLVGVVGATATAAALACGSATAAPSAFHQAPPSAKDQGPDLSARPDNLPNPRAEAQAKLRQDAVDQVLKGKATIKTINGRRVIEVQAPGAGKDAYKGDGSAKANAATKKNGKQGKGKYVEYDPDREAAVFTILAEFGDETKSPQGGDPGPAANQIAEPDRATDNSTYWEPKFDRSHFMEMMFGEGESFKDFYEKQSQGRFTVTGDVSDWVKLPYNEARYGHNPVEGDGTSEAEGYWAFVADAVTAWHKKQKAEGKTDAEIKQYLSQFDKWDRYDYDGDGDFNEPDGYVDHFQVIHAGEGEEAGGGAQGEDAIWSHRWAVQSGYGETGPEGNKSGGAQIGDTGIWVQDYTTEPENGGLGVFTHEFGHDLGLPDLYDTSGGSTNSSAFWTLMSSGSWLNHGKDSIGTTPGYMGAWEKLFLGWNDVKVVEHGKDQTVTTGPADKDDKKLPQTVAVALPDKTVTTEYNTPKTGEYEWWSGRGDDLSNTLSRELDLTSASSASVSAAVARDTEADYDFFHAQVSTDGGASWKDVAEPESGTAMDWTTKTYDLSEYAGQKITFRFLYQTDGGVDEPGVFLDDIVTTIDGTSDTDGAESADSTWTADGFTRINGTVSKQVPQAYLAEYRRYNDYDTTLKTGPYNFGFADKPNWVERFPYQDGLLVWFYNGEYKDNNTYLHPGGGMALPVDANPKAMKWADGTLMSNRIQPYDATFGTKKTDAFTLHKKNDPVQVPSRPAVKTFDDTDPDAYYDASNKYGSTKVAGSGTRITVQNQTPKSMKLNISFAK